MRWLTFVGLLVQNVLICHAAHYAGMEVEQAQRPRVAGGQVKSRPHAAPKVQPKRQQRQHQQREHPRLPRHVSNEDTDGRHLARRGAAERARSAFIAEDQSVTHQAFVVAVEASPTDAKSLVLGSSAGDADRRCGTSAVTHLLPQCSHDLFRKFKALSHVLRENPGGMQEAFGSALLLGDGGRWNLSSCQASLNSDDAGSSQQAEKQVRDGQRRRPGGKAPPRPAHARDVKVKKGKKGNKAAAKRRAVELLQDGDQRMLPGHEWEEALEAKVDGGDSAALGEDAGGSARPREGRKREQEYRWPPDARLILDAQYANVPRCCNAEEIEGLRTSEGSAAAWTRRALDSLEMVSVDVCADIASYRETRRRAVNALLHDEATGDGPSLPKPKCGAPVALVQVWPKPGTCSDLTPCPLVIQLPGEGNLLQGIGDPWMLVQARCASCFEELRAVLVTPSLELDLESPTRSSNKQVHFRLAPLVKTMLKRHSSLDPNRVYLVAQSRGCDTALRAGLLYPDIFALVVMSGLFDVSPDTTSLIKSKFDQRGSPSRTLRLGRLKSLSFHMGDRDRSTDPLNFYGKLSSVLRPLSTQLKVDLRIYPEGSHTVWYAAWNALHDTLWTASAPVAEATMLARVPFTCRGPAALGQARMVIIIFVLGLCASAWSWVQPKSMPHWAWHLLRLAWPNLPGRWLDASSSEARLARREAWQVGAARCPETPPEDRPASRLNRERLGSLSSFLDLLLPESEQLALCAADGSVRPLTHRMLFSSVAEFDLAHYGVAPQMHVAMMMPAGELSAGLLLALVARYAVAPLSADLRREELRAAMQLLHVQAVITTQAIADRMGDVFADLPVLVARPSGTAGTIRLTLARGHEPSATASHADAGDLQAAASSALGLNGAEDVVLLLQTSGTTSRPKIVPVTLRRLALGALAYGDAVALDEEDVGLNVMPFHHIGGILTNLLAVVLHGGCVVCAPEMSESKALQWMSKHKVSYYSAVPTTHQLMLQVFEEAKASRGSIADVQLRAIATGAAHLPHPLAVRLREATSASVVPTYGMSECMPICAHCSGYALERPESVGLPVGEMQLFDDGGAKVPAGQVGEVCVQGPLCMPQYLGNGIADFRGGSWFRTGDLGMLDADGNLYLAGRSKEVVNRGGELVSPFEVESVLAALPGVNRCMVFALPHKELGETPAVAIVPEESAGGCLSLKALQSAVLQKLSPVKVPEVLVLVPDIPKGTTGKVQRIGFAERLGMSEISANTPSAERTFKVDVETFNGRWRLQQKNVDTAEGEGAGGAAPELEAEGVFDSLGFARRLRSSHDAVYQQVQEALYGLCVVQLIVHHWLPHGTLGQLLPGQPGWVVGILQDIQDSRTLLVMIFPLLGFFDGREALSTEGVNFRRAYVVFGLYVAMAWPAILQPLGSCGVATFHRWPLYVWLICMAIVRASKLFRVPAFFQVCIPFVLAPHFGHTMDNLHELLGLQDPSAASTFVSPSLLLVEHRFYYSVGAKLYFAGCYLVGYHFLARDAISQRMLEVLSVTTPRVRCAAALIFMLLTVVWENCTVPFDASLPEELADWPRFFGAAYPIMAVVDWACMASLALAVCAGTPLLRLMGRCILGTMICHMYFQLPFPALLQQAAISGGPFGALVIFCIVPVVYVLSIGRAFQAVLLFPLKRCRLLA